MTARELEELLHVPNLKPTLTRLVRQSRVERAKIAGRSGVLRLPVAAAATRSGGNGKRRRRPNAASGLCPIPARSLPCWSRSSATRDRRRANGLGGWPAKESAWERPRFKRCWTTINCP